MGVTFATLQCWPGQGYVCMSRIFAAYSVGGLVGPLLGAVSGLRAPFAAYLGLTLLIAVPAALLPQPVRRGAFAGDRAALRSRGFWVAVVGIGFAVMALGTLEGVLPLHLSTGLAQSGIGVLYAGVAVVVAVSAAVTARIRPPRALAAAATVPIVAGLTFAGASSTVPVWLVALVVAGVGIGMANTAAIGVLLEAVPTERIVTAMVLWSQLGIVGYLLAPALGGAIVERVGYGAAALPAAGAAPLVGLALVWQRDAGRR